MENLHIRTVDNTNKSLASPLKTQNLPIHPGHINYVTLYLVNFVCYLHIIIRIVFAQGEAHISQVCENIYHNLDNKCNHGFESEYNQNSDVIPLLNDFIINSKIL